MKYIMVLDEKVILKMSGVKWKLLNDVNLVTKFETWNKSDSWDAMMTQFVGQ